MELRVCRILFPFFFFVCVVFSCTFSVDYKGGQYTCKTNADCPPEFTCQGTSCVASGSEPQTCTDAGCNKPDAPLKKCTSHDDCALTESCRPDIDNTGRVCTFRCNVVTQAGCANNEVCVVSDARGYCREKRGANRAGQLCKQDLDCELHLYCRPVKGYPSIRRCASACDLRKGCALAEQRCLRLRPEDDPIGFCEPIPTVVKEDQICSGDLICQNGFKCTREPGDTYPRCRK